MENKILAGDSGLNVVSMFDGISCGQLALSRAGKKVANYFACEIKNTAISVTTENYPNTIQLGDVRNIHVTNIGIEVDRYRGQNTRIIEIDNVDLLIGGSPCKGISRMNQLQQGLKHKESILFYEYARVLEEIRLKNKDVKFFLENTHGNREATDIITEVMGVKPYSVNSKLVSAQNRPRYYWTNIDGFEMPKDRGITTKDVFDYSGGIVPENRLKWLLSESGERSIRQGYCKINPFPKSGCLTANGHAKWNENYIYKDGVYRFLSHSDLEKLQTLPIGYTKILNYEDAYDVIGDGWNIDTIVEFFKHI